ncbi:MAG: glycogen debranching enzyme, partial [Burkholderiales bacterium]
QREAEQSVNFVTCHDGFTLNDLVSYNSKHNESNGEDNRDGTDDNRSWNCGVEGPADDLSIEALRTRQVKNLLAIELLATGTPMLRMGDEVRHTQCGNNNAYCQDNDISWLDWGLLQRHPDIHRFVRLLTAFRQQRDLGSDAAALTLNQLLASVDATWHGVALGCPDWSEHSHSLALTARLLSGRAVVHVMFNAFWEPLVFELPAPERAGGRSWRRCIDTALPSPHDITSPDTAPDVMASTYRVEPRSLVLLAIQLTGGIGGEPGPPGVPCPG